MRYLIFALILIIAACEVSQDQVEKIKDDILVEVDKRFKMSSMDEVLSDPLTPAALRVIPYFAWAHDSKDSIETYGFYVMNQDGNSTRESIVPSDTLLAWLRDSIISGVPAQNLTYSNDSLTIDNGNTVIITGFADSTITTDTLAAHLLRHIANEVVIQRNIDSLGVHRVDIQSLENFRSFFVDDLADIYSQTFPNNSIIERRTTGAKYLVKSTGIVGYTIDSITLVPTGGSYAYLLADGLEYQYSHFDKGSEAGEVVLRRARDWCYEIGDAYRINLPDTVTLTDSVRIKPNIHFKGTATTGGDLNGKVGSMILADLNDASKPVFVIDSTSSYHSSIGLTNMHIQALSPASCAVQLIHPNAPLFERITIDGGVGDRYFKDGIRMSASINTEIREIRIKHIEDIGIHAYTSNIQGTTTTLHKCWITAADIGLKQDSASMGLVATELIMESIDSSAVIAENNWFQLRGGYTEDIPLNNTKTAAIFDLGSKFPSGAVHPTYQISNTKITPQSGGDPNNPAIKVDYASRLIVEDCYFINVGFSLNTTANTGPISWINNMERTGTNFVYDLKGLADTSKLTMIAGSKGFSSTPKSYIGGDLWFPTFFTDDAPITGHRNIDQDGNNIYFTGGGIVSVGTATNYGRGTLQSNGYIYSQVGMRLANGRAYAIYDAGGSPMNMLALDGSNQITFGSVSSNDFTIQGGVGSNDDIIFQGGTGNPVLIKLTGGGEVLIGSDTDNGTFDIQLDGTVLITSDLTLDETNDIRIVTGSGSPESAVTAGVGSTFHRSDGGAGTSFYVKESGTGNTGWAAK